MSSVIPRILLAGLLLTWAGLGVWICLKAPFNSGTDESIRYVAFATATNRWATEDDFRRYDVEHFYYPPLYFLVLAPFFGDDPSFTRDYPKAGWPEENYIFRGGNNLVSRAWADSVPAPLVRLYRTAKFLSLALGVAAICCLLRTLLFLFPGPNRWWTALAGAAPLLLLPQFLYYQTLCNNDALLNALGAGALLLFVEAMLALEEGRARKFNLLSLATAVCVGLGFFTKESAVVLLPLLVGLAAARLTNTSQPLRRRLAVSLAHLAILLLAVIAAGGWWEIHTATRSGLAGLAAQKAAHPWAFSATYARDIVWWTAMTTHLTRSYFALFTGPMIGIPDSILTAYLLLPSGLLLLLAVASLKARGGAPAPAPSRRPIRLLLWGIIGATCVGNYLAVMAYNLVATAPHGRLMFPTLVASHALFAGAIVRLSGGRRRLISLAAIALTLGFGLLFQWTFRHRMADAVRQPQEHLYTIAYDATGGDMMETLGPVWRGTFKEPFVLPRGRLKALRVQILRRINLPIYGSTVRGTLTFMDASGKPAVIHLKPFPLGDNDGTQRWTDLELSSPVSLTQATPALVTLAADKPRLSFPLGAAYYIGTRNAAFTGVGNASFNGATLETSLSMAAVYDGPFG